MTPRTSQPRRWGTVLLVDDDEAVCSRRWSRSCGPDGVHVLIAPSGDRAIECSRSAVDEVASLSATTRCQGMNGADCCGPAPDCAGRM